MGFYPSSGLIYDATVEVFSTSLYHSCQTNNLRSRTAANHGFSSSVIFPSKSVFILFFSLLFYFLLPLSTTSPASILLRHSILTFHYCTKADMYSFFYNTPVVKYSSEVDYASLFHHNICVNDGVWKDNCSRRNRCPRTHIGCWVSVASSPPAWGIRLHQER